MGRNEELLIRPQSFRADEIAQSVKSADDLSWIPGSQIVERDDCLPKVALWPPHVLWCTHAQTK